MQVLNSLTIERVTYFCNLIVVHTLSYTLAAAIYVGVVTTPQWGAAITLVINLVDEKRAAGAAAAHGYILQVFLFSTNFSIV